VTSAAVSAESGRAKVIRSACAAFRSYGATRGLSMDDLTTQEKELITILRTDTEFKVAIINTKGEWFVRLEDIGSKLNGVGKGANFAKAWDEVKPSAESVQAYHAAEGKAGKSG
jgi:hypothetical protein